MKLHTYRLYGPGGEHLGSAEFPAGAFARDLADCFESEGLLPPCQSRAAISSTSYEFTTRSGERYTAKRNRGSRT